MSPPLHRGALFTDLYQLTMAQVYFSFDMADQKACYEHYFRTYPSYGEHRAGYCIAGGLRSPPGAVVGASVRRVRSASPGLDARRFGRSPVQQGLSRLVG